jgi:hypothetical protein
LHQSLSFKVTRLEVEDGIIQRKDFNFKTLAFFREIKNIPSKKTKESQDFVEEDQKKIELVNDLVQETEGKLANKEKFYYKVCIN